MNADISVVIPLYNKASYILRALNSVLNQTVLPNEIIIVDDGSTDESAEIVNRIKNERVKLIQQKNAGVSVSRNRGVAEAKNDLIAFLDADDEWKPLFIESILSLSITHPNCGIYATSYERHGRDHRVSLPRISVNLKKGWRGIINNYFEAALYDPPFYTSSIAVRKQAFDNAGGFPTGINMGEDLDTWLRICLQYPIAYENIPLVTYYVETNNSLSTKSKLEECIIVYTASALLQQGKVPYELQESLKEYIYQYQIDLARKFIKNGDTFNAKLVLKKSKSTNRFRLVHLWWSFWAHIPPSLSKICFQFIKLIRRVK